MVGQLSIEKEHLQNVRAITDGNGASSSSRRQRKLSGPNSEGEKSLIKKDPIWLISPKTQISAFNCCLCSLDEVVATPAFNVNVIESAYDKDFKLFDVINNSKNVGFIDSALASLSMLAVSIGIYVIQYCKLREVEKSSNYFYFSRLFKSFNEEEVKNKMGEIRQDTHSADDLITYEYLQTAAYFYPPDISPIACWRRRFFASGEDKHRLKTLGLFLKNSKQKKLDNLLKAIINKREGINADDQSLSDQNIESYLETAAYFYQPDPLSIKYWRRRFFAPKNKKRQRKTLDTFLNSMVDELNKKITEQVCSLLNNEVYELLNDKKQLNYFTTKKNVKNHWTIALDEKYKEKFFSYVDHLIKANSDTTIKENLEKKNNAIAPVLSALGQASFVYWLLLFLFYFFPIAPVATTAMISVIPLGMSLLAALPLLLIYNIIKANNTYNTNKKMTKDIIENQHKEMLEKKLACLNKQSLYLKFTKNKEISSTIRLKNSTLLKKLHEVIKKRRFSKYHAIGMGFLEGCFLPLFVGWVFLDATKVILTYEFCPSAIALTSFTPIGLLASAIIAGIVLVLGVSYGVYSAYKAKNVHDMRFNDLEDKINALEKELGNKIILEKDYDRILRRFSSTKPLWTDIKKGINRFMAILKRLGTGSLVFRLVLWAPLMAIYAAIVASSTVPTFFPIILIIGTVIGAFTLASWYLYAYNVESKTTQAQRIVEYFVQSEQLIEINQKMAFPVIESVGKEDLITEVSTSPETLIKPENDIKFMSQKSSQEDDPPKVDNAHLGTVNAIKAQTETGRQISSTSSHSQGLFKVSVLVHNEENLGTCLSPAIC